MVIAELKSEVEETLVEVADDFSCVFVSFLNDDVNVICCLYIICTCSLKCLFLKLF